VEIGCGLQRACQRLLAVLGSGLDSFWHQTEIETARTKFDRRNEAG